MKTPSIHKVKSADRTLDILEALSVAPNPLTASRLSDVLGIPKSSFFHLAGTLLDRDYLVLDDENCYRLGPKVAELARSVGSGVPPDLLLAPILERFRNSVNESASFNIQRGDDVEVVATCSSRHSLSYTMTTGDLAPLYAVSAGKIILADKDKTWLGSYLDRVKFEQIAPNTIQSRDRLVHEINQTRNDGYGFVDQEFTPGIVGIAAAVRRDGAVLGAFNVAIPSARFDANVNVLVRQQLRNMVKRAETILSQ